MNQVGNKSEREGGGGWGVDWSKEGMKCAKWFVTRKSNS